MKDTLPYRVRLGAYEVDLRAGVVRTDEQSVCLQGQPFSVLLMLIERGGEIVTRDEIHKKLWPNDTAVDFRSWHKYCNQEAAAGPGRLG